MLRKALFILPLAVLTVFNIMAQPPISARRIEYHNGNTFLFRGSTLDTIEIQDPITNEWIQQLHMAPVDRPIAMNGKKIYNNAEVTTPVERRNDIIPFSFEEYVLNKIKTDIKALPDGSYYLHLDNIVVDKRGTVQYYSVDTLSVLRKAVAKVMKGPLFVPAKAGHRKVTAIYESYTSSFEIVVKGHEVTFIRDRVFPTVKSNM